MVAVTQRAGRQTPAQSRVVQIPPSMTVQAIPLTRILIITDAWLPQINGVVRSIEALVREGPALGVEIKVLAANEFRTVPLPTYPQVRVAVTRPGEVGRRIERLEPDFIHIATEGPLGLCAWFACRRAGRSFTTCYHTRFPEYLAARRVAPSRFVYALLRRFHNAGSGMMVSTETLGRELDTRGFVRLMRWSHGVDCDLFRPRAASIFEFPRPIFLTCARVAIEKNSRRVSVTRSAGFKGRRWGRTGEEEASDALSWSAFRRRNARREACRRLRECRRIRVPQFDRHLWPRAA